MIPNIPFGSWTRDYIIDPLRGNIIFDIFSAIVGSMINGWGVKFDASGQNSNERVQHYMLQWQNGQLVTVWPEEFTTNRAKWIPLPAWDQRK
jgi:hypothetical protein